MQTVPDNSKMDTPLAKAEPISDASGYSVTAYLKRVKNASQKMWEVKQAVLPGRPWWCRCTAKQVGTAWRKLQLVERRPWWRRLSGTYGLGETHAGAVHARWTATHAGAVLGELQPMRRIHIGAVHEGLPPLGRTMLENVTEWGRSNSRDNIIGWL